MVIALLFAPGEHPSITQLCDNRDYLAHAVSIENSEHCTAASFCLRKGIAIIHAENGIYVPSTGNRKIGKRIIAGVFYIVGISNGTLRSLTDDEITEFSLRFWEPETFSDEELIEAWIDTLFGEL